MPAADPLALVAECARRSSVCWLSWEYAAAHGRVRVGERLVWHAWHDGAIVVVDGDGAQRLDGLADAAEARVTLRSKDTGGRVVTCAVGVLRVDPEDPAWDAHAGALAAVRLNLPEPARTVDAWREGGAVLRIVPQGSGAPPLP